MATTKQKSRQAITLKGSTELVTEFFKYAVNTYEFQITTILYQLTPAQRILFQREVYPSDDFHMVKKYGQTVLVTQDLALENYLDRYALFFFANITSLMSEHLEFSHKFKVRTLILVDLTMFKSNRVVVNRFGHTTRSRDHLKGYQNAPRALGVRH
jgi:hypothetical protein